LPFFGLTTPCWFAGCCHRSEESCCTNTHSKTKSILTIQNMPWHLLLWTLTNFSLLRRRYSDWTVRVSNPSRDKRSPLLQKRPHRLWGPPSLLRNGDRGSCWR
jgi:hypothetical protein